MKKSHAQRGVSYWVLAVLLALIGAAALYPILYVFSMAFSDPGAAYRGEVFLLPRGFSLEAFKMVLSNPEVGRSYLNTLFYTFFGTLINLLMTVLAAFVLTQPAFCLRKVLLPAITLTMFFSGGMIPNYLLINQLHLYNTRWVMLLPGAINTFNLMIALSYFRTIPAEIYEAARMDGANDIVLLFSIALHLVGPLLATLTVFYAVAHWNNYFSAMMYLPNQKLQPMQMYLVKVLNMGSETLAGGLDAGSERTMLLSQLKYAVIVAAMLPIMVIYPFMQKYFVKGVMIGSVKG